MTRLKIYYNGKTQVFNRDIAKSYINQASSRDIFNVWNNNGFKLISDVDVTSGTEIIENSDYIIILRDFTHHGMHDPDISVRIMYDNSIRDFIVDKYRLKIRKDIFVGGLYNFGTGTMFIFSDIQKIIDKKPISNNFLFFSGIDKIIRAVNDGDYYLNKKYGFVNLNLKDSYSSFKNINKKMPLINFKNPTQTKQNKINITSNVNRAISHINKKTNQQATSNILKQISGLCGEWIFYTYLESLLQMKIIKKYEWISEPSNNPYADHDFEVTENNGKKKYYEIKSFKNNNKSFLSIGEYDFALKNKNNWSLIKIDISHIDLTAVNSSSDINMIDESNFKFLTFDDIDGSKTISQFKI